VTTYSPGTEGVVWVYKTMCVVVCWMMKLFSCCFRRWSQPSVISRIRQQLRRLAAFAVCAASWHH